MLRVADVRDVFETVMPDDVIEALVRKEGLQQRHRKFDALRFVRAMVIAAATRYGGRQADVMRAYFDTGADRVVRGGFYRWFGPELERVMESVKDRALNYASNQPCDLPGWLGKYVRDWHIVDSTTIRLDDALKAEYPGTGDYAALKVHKRYSVGLGTAIGYHLSPARDHDNIHLNIDESWRGLGLLVDLGYASFDLIRRCHVFGVTFAMRLKESWKPKVQSISRGSVKKALFPGTDLDVALEKNLELGGKVIDMEVTLGSGEATVQCRLVGVRAPDKGYRFYLTNLAGSIGPRQIADLYRVRWEIESDNKLNKSCLNVDEIGAKSSSTVRAMIHAAMTSSIMVCLVAHHYRLQESPPKRGKAERSKPPIHAQSLAMAIGSSSNSIAEAMSLQGPEADRIWEKVTAVIEHLGKDPNWRRNPSILDQLRGWKVSPGRPKKAKPASQAA